MKNMIDKNIDKINLNSNEYATTDLYFAAYLRAAGVKLIRTDKDISGKRMYFIFEKLGTGIEDLKLGWQNDTEKLPAQSFANAIKILKSLCFQ